MTAAESEALSVSADVLVTVLLVLALAVFVVGTWWQHKAGRTNLVALGLALVTLALLV